MKKIIITIVFLLLASCGPISKGSGDKTYKMRLIDGTRITVHYAECAPVDGLIWCWKEEREYGDPPDATYNAIEFAVED